MNPFTAAFRDDQQVLAALSTDKLGFADKRATNLHADPPVVKGFFPIHYAAFGDAVGALSLLASVQMDALTQEDVVLEVDGALRYLLPSGSSPLHVAVLTNSQRVLPLLRACVGLRNSQNSPALHFAAALNRLECLNMLMEEMPIRDQRGNNVLGICALFGRLQALQSLQDICFRDRRLTVLLLRLVFAANEQGQKPEDLALQKIELRDAGTTEESKKECYRQILKLKRTAVADLKGKGIVHPILQMLMEDEAPTGQQPAVELIV